MSDMYSRYIKGHDPAGWVSVGSDTGIVTTLGNIDREAAYVKDNIYVVTICAVDNGITQRNIYRMYTLLIAITSLKVYVQLLFFLPGKPPETGTATLSIHITDENDNTPTLLNSTFDMCQWDGPSLAKITASDLDDDPYSGPFNFKLHGDVAGKWAVNPEQGELKFCHWKPMKCKKVFLFNYPMTEHAYWDVQGIQ